MKCLFRKTNVAYEFSGVRDEEQVAPILTQEIDYDDRIHSLCELARQAFSSRLEFERKDVDLAGPSQQEFNIFYEQYLRERA